MFTATPYLISGELALNFDTPVTYDLYSPSFFTSAVLSGDGTVFAFNDGEGNVASGSTRVHAKVNGVWTWLDDIFEYAIAGPLAISYDGSIIAAPHNSGITVATRSGNTWVENHFDYDLTYLGSNLQTFTISGDGKYIAACYDGSLVGDEKIYIFAESGGTWSLQQTISGANGYAPVALDYSGSTLLVGTGRAYVRTGTTWAIQQLLSAGNFCAISTDGNTAVFSNVFYNNNQGATYVYTRVGTTWTLQQTITRGNTYDQWGYFVKIAPDKSYLVIGSNGFGSALYRLQGTQYIEDSTYTGVSGTYNGVSDNGVDLLVGYETLSSPTGQRLYLRSKQRV